MNYKHLIESDNSSSEIVNSLFKSGEYSAGTLEILKKVEEFRALANDIRVGLEKLKNSMPFDFRKDKEISEEFLRAASGLSETDTGIFGVYARIKRLAGEWSTQMGRFSPPSSSSATKYSFVPKSKELEYFLAKEMADYISVERNGNYIINTTEISPKDFYKRLKVAGFLEPRDYNSSVGNF